MPPPLALILTIVCVSVLLWRDSRMGAKSSGALWLPVIWIFLIGSKFVSQWLSLFGLMTAAPTLEEGSPIDAVCFFGLILAGLFVLIRRRVAVTQFVRNNQWMTIFLVYCFLAIIWSDFPFVAFKRWIKILGHPIMALVVLTDSAPEQAVRRVLNRSGYLMLPLSVLFIKYYPQFGRYWDSWTGVAGNAGIHNNKNELGYVLMLFGLFFSWKLLSFRRVGRGEGWKETAITIAFLGMIFWLFSMADSATSLACVVLGASTMVIVSLPLVSRRFIGSYILAGLLMAFAAQASFGAYDALVKLLGRNATLTDRTAVWQDVFAIDRSPILGAGFESFWLGPRLDVLWAKWWWHPTQAHNGYIETYLNLGWVGVAILAALLIATFFKARLALIRDLDFGRFRLAVLFAIIVYNYTEATFIGVHLVWTFFYLIALDYPAVEHVVAKVPLADPSHHAPEGDRGFRRFAAFQPTQQFPFEPTPQVRRWQ